MQLPSMPSANITGSGPVIRSGAPPGVVAGRVPSANSVPSTTSSAPETAPTGNQPVGRGQPSPAAQAPAPPSSASETTSRERGDERSERSPSARRSGSGSEGQPDGSRSGDAPQNRPDGTENGGDNSVSPEQQAVVNELRARDREVRQHEQAHQTVGGQYTGGATYDYQRGPDGKLYATGGQVSIDTSKVPDDPRATINKMQTVRAAALAPAEPSPQDIRVAQEATSKMLAAQAELRAERREATASGAENAPQSGALSEPQGAGSDPRITLFQDVDGFSDSSDESEAGPRFQAIA